jgi:hypothetical protein
VDVFWGLCFGGCIYVLVEVSCVLVDVFGVLLVVFYFRGIILVVLWFVFYVLVEVFCVLVDVCCVLVDMFCILVIHLWFPFGTSAHVHLRSLYPLYYYNVLLRDTILSVNEPVYIVLRTVHCMNSTTYPYVILTVRVYHYYLRDHFLSTLI